jgi:hypothetical protein
MLQWHGYDQPELQRTNEPVGGSTVTLRNGCLTISCGGREMLLGISGDAVQLNLRLNDESHHYDRATVDQIIVRGAGRNQSIDVPADAFDMLVVARGAYVRQPNEIPIDLHASRAQRHRWAADDFGIV